MYHIFFFTNKEYLFFVLGLVQAEALVLKKKRPKFNLAFICAWKCSVYGSFQLWSIMVALQQREGKIWCNNRTTANIYIYNMKGLIFCYCLIKIFNRKSQFFIHITSLMKCSIKNFTFIIFYLWFPKFFKNPLMKVW